MLSILSASPSSLTCRRSSMCCLALSRDRRHRQHRAMIASLLEDGLKTITRGHNQPDPSHLRLDRDRHEGLHEGVQGGVQVDDLGILCGMLE